MKLSAIDSIIYELSNHQMLPERQISRIFMANPDSDGKILAKSIVLQAFQKEILDFPDKFTQYQQHNFLKNITMKKIRTLSGVTTVTVLTKPFACPGKCIFCPNDVRMPKSYISSEPGAQRAKNNLFDPYLQTFNRLVALHKIGHPTAKVELIVLGGTWSAYPEKYQIWFIKRCFDALNAFVSEAKVPLVKPDMDVYNFNPVIESDGKVNYNLSVSQPPDQRQVATWAELEAVQVTNVSAQTRCVGLSIETRPDELTEKEVIKIRRLGATKVQLGVQSLDDEVLRLNKRGHDTEQTARAFTLLRQLGFKIHVHYMPNLYGSTPEKDATDFGRLFSDPRFCPDEVKIYPCSLIDGTELMDYFKQNKWRPYSKEELTQVLAKCLLQVPLYCRVTRVIRDIPGPEIVEGNKTTNLRQDVEQFIHQTGINLVEIRSREIRNKKVSFNDLTLTENIYLTANSTEFFLQFVTPANDVAGFLRLSLPDTPSYLAELSDAALIREVHVYGASIEIGKEEIDAPQHIGLGTKLIERAIALAKTKGYKKIAVISSIGTRDYYKKFGFELTGLYQTLSLQEQVQKPADDRHCQAE